MMDNLQSAAATKGSNNQHHHQHHQSQHNWPSSSGSHGFCVQKEHVPTMKGCEKLFEPLLADFFVDPNPFDNPSAGIIGVPVPGSRGDLFRKEMIELTEKIVLSLFRCDHPRPANSNLPHLSNFIKDIMNRTRLSTLTIIVAIFYLDRLKQIHPACKGNYGSGHRLILSSIMIASKFLFDDTFDNKTWFLVSRCFSLSEINVMENELLYCLNYKLAIRPDEFVQFSSILAEKLASQILCKRMPGLKSVPANSIINPGPSSTANRHLNHSQSNHQHQNHNHQSMPSAAGLNDSSNSSKQFLDYPSPLSTSSATEEQTMIPDKSPPMAVKKHEHHKIHNMSSSVSPKNNNGSATTLNSKQFPLCY